MAGLEPVKRVASFVYDFDVHGGDIGDIVLNKHLPDGAIITNGMIYVDTALTSGGSATIALKVLTSEDVLAAEAVASFTLAALIDVVPLNSAATSITTTAAAAVTMSIAVAALTAGKMTIVLEYYLL